MEIRRKLEQTNEPISFKTIRLFIMIGLILNACTIIASVDYLYNNAKYFELIVASFIFLIILIIIRRLNTSE